RKQEDFSYDKTKEHSDYKKALETLIGCVAYTNKAKKWLDTFENERSSKSVNKFWMTVNEELIDSKIKNEENEYDLTLTTNVNKQMGTYVNATTSRLTKRFLECAEESPPKRVPKEAINDSPNNPFTVSGIPGESNSNDSGTPDESNSDKSYHPSSDEADKSELSEGAKKWFIGTLDVSNLLLEYRDMSIQKASDNKIDEVAEILSLNHIFLFEHNVSSGISLMIEPESLKSIFNNIKEEFTPYQMSDDDILRCHKMAKTASEDFEKCKSLLRKWQKELVDDQEDLILEIFESIQELKEDTFVHEVFEPVIKPFFRNINFKCEWSTDVLEASAHRKHKFDPSLQGRKADFSVYMPIRVNKFYLLVSEIKSADFMLSNKNKISLEDCDFVKLGNEMKDILDKCINNGVDNKNLIICGLLVEGKFSMLAICHGFKIRSNIPDDPFGKILSSSG
ncbi:1376_t:CDS:10, partial [Ambispora leptoticha]